MVGMVIMVIGATLFTKQHYVLDLAGGAAMAAIGIFVGITWVFSRPAQKLASKKGTEDAIEPVDSLN